MIEIRSRIIEPIPLEPNSEITTQKTKRTKTVTPKGTRTTLDGEGKRTKWPLYSTRRFKGFYHIVEKIGRLEWNLLKYDEVGFLIPTDII